MKILCVDDDATSRTLFKSGLSSRLMPEDEIMISTCAEDGLDVINNHSIDMVITDMKMPGLSGIDFLKKIKELEPDIEVIVITGHASINTAVEAMKIGARDYLEKPINIPILLEKISNIRDLINKQHELEEYKMAKEIIEDNAGEDISRLEIFNQNLQNRLSAIKETAQSKVSDSEKVKKIKLLLEKTL
ncbi:MAG: Ntr family protein two-component system response regulator [uncultured bacterium]|nr:MAG: Ntr family protein two-component system response regulator [uncultured bacterium]